MTRFYVDSRTKSHAVRDSQGDDPSQQGLTAETPGVVKYWDTPGHLKEANELCDSLNATLADGLHNVGIGYFMSVTMYWGEGSGSFSYDHQIASSTLPTENSGVVFDMLFKQLKQRFIDANPNYTINSSFLVTNFNRV